MSEQIIVSIVVKKLLSDGLKVATEVSNFYRSADICALDNNGDILIIECKVSDIKRALEQTKIHTLSADKVYIATFAKKIKKSTLDKVRKAGIGLIYVTPEEEEVNYIETANINNPWLIYKMKVKERLLELA